MKKIFDRPVVFILILAVLAGYLFFFRLGSLALTDPDETFYAQTSKEMLQKGEWLTPTLYGKPQFEKPILFYWLVHISYLICGVNEFAARLPSAVFALIGLVAMYLLGSTLFGRRAGALAAVILGTNVEYIVLARACVTDMVLTVFMLIGVYRFFCGYFEGKRYGYVLSGVAFGLAVLTKGPVFLALALGVIFLFLLLAKDLGAVKKMPVVWAVVAYLAVTVPWYLIAYKLHGTTFIDEFFGFHNITRFTSSEHKIGSQVYYNLPIMMGGFFPWSVFLPFGIWHMIKKARVQDPAAAKERKASMFILLWLAVIFFFFTASSTKLPTYIFPSFVAAALIVAVLWDDFLKGAPAAGKGLTVSFYCLMALILPGAIGGIVYSVVDYPSITAGVSVLSGLLAFGMALACVAFMKRRFLCAFAMIAYAVGIILYPLSALVLPQIERYETSKTIAMQLKEYMRPGEGLACESNFRAGLAFYTGVFPVDIDKHHDLVRFLGAQDRVWCVMKEKNHRELYELDTKPFYTRPSYLVYKIGKRAIVTNLMPADGKYLVRRERK